MKRRKPRPPASASGLPATLPPEGLIAAEEANISAAIAEWCASRHPEGFDSEASYLVLETTFFRLLRTNYGVLDAAVIVDMALRGHPPADRALRRLIAMAIETDRFQTLPLSVRDYSRRLTEQTSPLGVYSSQAPQVANHFLRDAVLVILMRQVKKSWPAVPLLNSSPTRHSAAYLVGAPLGLSERQARRIYQADKGQSRRISEFLMSRPNGPFPNGS